MKFWRTFAVLLSGTALAAGCYLLLSNMSRPRTVPARGIPEVITVIVGEEEFEERIEALGTAQARESVIITASVTELIDEIHFREGQEVRKGELLVTLEQAEEQANLRQAQLAFDEDERLLQIASRLHGKKAVAQTEYERHVYGRDAARIRLEVAEAKVRERTITAPFDGRIGIRRISPGTLVTPGTPIATLDDLTVIRLFFTVPETFLGVMRTGQAVEARCAAFPEILFKGEVSTIDSRVDADTRAVTVIAEFSNPDHRIKPGMLMKVELIGRRRTSPSIMEKSLLSYGRNHFVFVVGADSRAERRQVELGLRTFGRIEITAGLEAGEKIVVEGISRIADGQQVKTAIPSPGNTETRP